MRSSNSFLCCAALTGLIIMSGLSAAGFSAMGRASAQAPQAAAPQKTQPAEAGILPDAPGKDTAKRICSSCHSVDVWAQQRHTPAQWAAIVDRMVSRGAEGTDDDFAQIVQYLSKNLGTTVPPGSPPAGTAPAGTAPAAAPSRKP